MSVQTPSAARHRVHELAVTEVEPLTDDAVAITFDVPAELESVFEFQAGQHVALLDPAGADDTRRSYSICSPAGGQLRVAVKQLPGGVFSTYACGQLQVGDTLMVLPPAGHFTTTFDSERRRNYAAIAVGSGITPVLSLLATALATEPDSRFTLLYGNRNGGSVMFLEELNDIKDTYPARFELFHVLSREPHGSDLFEGRFDAAKLERFFELLVPPDTMDEWFLCGPLGMVEAARAALLRHGAPAAAVHRELFHVDDLPPASPRAPEAPTADSSVTIVLDGRRTRLEVPTDGLSVLDAAVSVRPDAPYACKGGVCGTCRCRLVEGEVRMDCAYALEPDEIEAGVRLACQSHPVTPHVVLDFDAV